jgi:hypothetical protein
MDNCKICSGTFHNSPDRMLLCDHKDGSVHLGCCEHNCSMDGKPCKHKVAMYSKVAE